MRGKSVQAAFFLVLAGCSAAPSNSAQSSGRRPFTVTEVTTFNAPWALSFLPGSGVPLTKMALVTEKGGKLWLVDTGNGQKREVAGAPTVVAEGQGGLLDVVAAPSFAGDSMVYLTFSEPSQQSGSQLALARAKLSDVATSPKLTGLQVIWRNPTGGTGGHFGARIAFAPDGRSLFLSAGERQRFEPSQDVNLPMGKILHLTLDGKAISGRADERLGASTVAVTDPPEDSEVAKRTTGRQITWPGPNHTPAETWTLGHRNPLGLAFAPDGRLWEVEMGPKGGDELNLIVAGRNYGYPRVSNGDNYNGVPIPDHRAGDGFEPPKVFWNPVISPGGMIIYSGDLFPQWKGDALIAALSGKALLRVDIDGDKASKADQWDMGQRIRAVDQGPRGEVYLLEDAPGGRLLRLEPAK